MAVGDDHGRWPTGVPAGKVIMLIYLVTFSLRVAVGGGSPLPEGVCIGSRRNASHFDGYGGVSACVCTTLALISSLGAKILGSSGARVRRTATCRMVTFPGESLISFLACHSCHSCHSCHGVGGGDMNDTNVAA